MTSPSLTTLVRRPFEGLVAERDLVAMRQLIPSATLTARTSADFGGTDLVIASLLPMNWAALKREDGTVMVGMQATVPGNDTSRGLGAALKTALDSEPGTAVSTVDVAADSPRLQDIVEFAAEPVIEVHDSFDYWIDAGATRTEELDEGLAQANEAIMPTAAVGGLPHAYWVDAGAKEHLRWVLEEGEDQVIDAVARLHAKRNSGVGEGTKYVGSFRADGLTIPVWDLPKGFGVEGVEEEAAAFKARFEEALASTEPLTGLERRARGGIVARQVTLR
ncbi:MAG: DUF5926 family protein [Dermabacter sp.]|nr:DUF5926 family protein [Dermabacter sp.]